MEYKTAISKITADDQIIRGQKLSEMVTKYSFSQAIFWLITGRELTVSEEKVFNSLLVSAIDHGMGTASSQSARFVASGGNTVNTAVAAGVLALGELHGGAVEQAMKQLVGVNSVDDFVNDKLSKKEKIYGFGHRLYQEFDPRVKQILDICKENNYTSEYLTKALAIEQAIAKIKNKKIILNIDGLMAAIFLEMKLTPLQGRAMFIIARTPGLAAQVIEELASDNSVLRVDEEQIDYQG